LRGKVEKGNITSGRYVGIYQSQNQRCCRSGVRMELDSEALMVMSHERHDNDVTYNDPNVAFCLLRLNKARKDADEDLYCWHIANVYKSPFLHIHRHRFEGFEGEANSEICAMR